MLAKDIKNGTVVNYHDAPCMIETISVQSPSARGAATIYKYRARNLVTKAKIDIVLRGGESLDEANFERRPIKFMYADASHMHFLDQQDYNQYSLTLAEVASEAPYLTADLEGVQALIYNDECVGLQLPVVVELKVTQCDPGVRGNSATGRTKPATLETGLMVHVPEYLAEGETVKVDTRTGEFLSRV
jgi:elongation factor P